MFPTNKIFIILKIKHFHGLLTKILFFWCHTISREAEKKSINFAKIRTSGAYIAEIVVVRPNTGTEGTVKIKISRGTQIFEYTNLARRI